MQKIFLIFILVCCLFETRSQTLTLWVKDETTKLPIENAQINTVSSTFFTNSQGEFSLIKTKIGDKISIRLMGYETKELTINNLEGLTVYLLPTTYFLSMVVIKAKRNHKLDSLDLRKEYASVFAYKKPNFTDMFIKVDPNYKSPFANINPNSTASILKFNALSLFSFFNKKKKSVAKFKSILEQDEERNFVYQSFSKEKINELTKLSGDSLITFMNRYKPTIVEMKKMTSYALALYIKKSYDDFLKSYP